MFLTASCLCLNSCSLMDKEPDFVSPDYYYNTEDELQLALNGVYNRLIDTNGRMYSKGLFTYFALSDESHYLAQFNNQLRMQVFDASQLDIGRFWEVCYEGVSRANYLLASMEGRELTTDTEKAIKGEALFLRGYYYFILTSYFGEVPLRLTPTVNPDDNNLAKSPLKDIYAQITKDMKAAEELVMDIDVLGSNERISKTGVQAILARVYLKMAGQPLNDTGCYEDALTYAKKVITSQKHSLNTDYQQIFINHSQDINEPKECIWEVGMYGNKIGTEDLAGSVGVENGILCRSEAIGYSGGPIRITQKLYDAFEEGDLRRDWSIAPYRYEENSETGVYEKREWSSSQIYTRNPGKWRREYETGEKARQYNSTNFPVIRYSDVLLMKAEAENALHGPTSEAYDAINQVRRRAFGKPLDTPDATCDLPEGLSKEEFLEEVQNERFREFCFEGIRKLDLIRWGIYVQTMNALASDVEANAPNNFKYVATTGRNTTARNVVFPIPTTELTVNKLMTQNAGW